MDKFLIIVVLVSLVLIYLLIEVGGVYLLRKLGSVDTRLTRKQRTTVFVLLSLIGSGVIIYIIMTHDYRGLFS